MSGNQPKHLEHYRITREIGRGGMGVVFLAHDTTLDRDVAIKCLPPELAEDEERLERFEREAKLLAQLNHPNIATIHGLEVVDGKLYLVLEYVAGETLAERLCAGAVEIEESLPIAIQIAEAIEAAHDKDIIHRDLKPANIKFTTDGQVKVLDFGLAKAVDDQASGMTKLAEAPTRVQDASPTLPGMILGTAGYLSPEQARGRPVDKRTDVFSFGCVLFEMLTGMPPFPGETVTDSIAATLHKEVDWPHLPEDTPPIVRHVLRRCLERDRRNRLRDIGEARIQLAHAIDDPSSSSLGLTMAATVNAQPRRRWLATVILLAVAAVAATATWFATRSEHQSSPPIMRLVIPSQTGAYSYARLFTISPDGTKVAFVAQRRMGAGAGDEPLLWVRRLDEFEARELGPETSGGLFWSHDSRYIGFRADDKLWTIRDDGADKHLLSPMSGANRSTWNADMVILTSSQNGLSILRPDDPSPVALTTVDDDQFETHHDHPHFLPDGNQYLYLEVQYDPDQEFKTRKLFAGNLTTGTQTEIGSFPSNPWYVEPGFLVYVEDGTVKAVPFDIGELRIFGNSIVLAQNASYFKPTGNGAISASRDGVVVYAPVAGQPKLQWFDSDGSRLGRVGPPASYGGRFRIAPDGLSVAAGVADPRTAQKDVVILSVQSDTSRRLTSDARWEGYPSWSLDGQSVFLSTDHHGAPNIYSLDVNGSGVLREVYRRSGAWFASDVSPSGRILAMEGEEASGYDIWMAPLDGDGEPFAFIEARGSQTKPRFSADGSRIAYVSDESGVAEVFVDTFPQRSRALQVSIHGGDDPVWSPNGNKLYFRQRSFEDRAPAVMVVDFGNSDTSAPQSAEVLFSPGPFDGFDVSPDGERFLLRIVEDGTPDGHVILNWAEGR